MAGGVGSAFMGALDCFRDDSIVKSFLLRLLLVSMHSGVAARNRALHQP